MRTRQNVSLAEIIKYRSVWMGIAMILVILYHTPLQIHSHFLDSLKQTFYCGVDIFLFASGLGCYFSYSTHRNPLVFMKRRILRLAPVYLPFIIVWGIASYHFYDLPLPAFLGNLFAIQGFADHTSCFNWYITGLVLCYFLTPYYFELLEKIQKTTQMLLVVVLLFVLSVPFWNSYNTIIVTRLPIYFLGMYFAKLTEEKASFPPPILGILFVLSAFGVFLFVLFRKYFPDTLWEYGLFWYPFILITPGACVLMSIVAASFEKHHAAKWIVTALKKTGEYSFELFLVHISLFNVYDKLVEKGWLLESNLNCLFAVIIIVLLSILLKALANQFKGIFRRCSMNRSVS